MMNANSTYRAVLYGPGTIGSGEEVNLEYVDGKQVETLVIDVVEEGFTIRRTYRRGRETAEPIPYRFVEEDDTGGEPNVPN